MSYKIDTIEARCAAHAPLSSNGHFASGTVFGDWRITAFIGRGGNGEVYCAEHVALGTPAAVKVLIRDGERAEYRFEGEAKLLARLRSEAFPRFYTYGEANGAVYLAMELLEPGELPSGNKNVARFLLEICTAVAELHAQGLVHRDIKPENILWRDQQPVLADFGLVKDVSQSSNRSIRQLPEQPTTLAGTPGYAAPEQMERGEVSFAADIHALGVLADRCFNGNPPRSWARIIMRATSSIPAHRYSVVDELMHAIRWRNLWRNVGKAALVLFLVGLLVDILIVAVVIWLW